MTRSIRQLPALFARTFYARLGAGKVTASLVSALVALHVASTECAADTAPSFSWTVLPPPSEVSLNVGDGLGFGIAVGPIPASNVRILGTSLVETTTRRQLGAGRIALCSDEKPACSTDGPLALAANQPHRLWLKPDVSVPVVPGKYSGTITVAAAEKVAGDVIRTTIFITTEVHRWFGVLVIGLGVAAAWAITVPIRAQIQRATLLRPATILRERIDALTKRLSILTRTTPFLTERLQSNSSALDETALERKGYISSGLPLPWTTKSPNPVLYKTFLEEKAAELSGLDLLVDAAEILHTRWSAASPEERPRIETAIANLDSLADSDISNTEDLSTRIGTILDTAPSARALSAETASPRPKTYERISLEIRRLSGLVWAVYGLLTTAVGAYVLVWSNPGFGLPTDFWECLFWGFALPTGSQLLQATPTTVATSLGVSVPK
ncbi:hypothetical protein [Nisaea denitrificans]|uniref:hypothetical protein n=1 Tax=Nisaea denitrificans TaxID=390877 RepID=UPI000404BDEC|nr:hypothetical protein [Nisaea denitrificans]